MPGTLWTRLKTLFQEPKKEEEKEITLRIKFKLTDGMQPRKMKAIQGMPFGLRTPITVKLPENGRQTVRLGISCELPLFVCNKDTAKLVAPGQEISVDISESYGEGEIVARAYAIDNTFHEIVGA